MKPPDGYREGPAVAYVPMLTSLADYQRNPRVPIPLGYKRHENAETEPPMPDFIITTLRYSTQRLTIDT